MGDAPVSEQRVYRTLEVAFVVIIVGLVVPGLIEMRNGNRAHGMYWSAIHNWSDGRYEGARSDLEWYARKRPHDRDALCDLSIMRYFTRDFVGAVEACKRSLAGEETKDWQERELAFLKARAAGEVPAGMRPPIFRPRDERPDEFKDALDELRKARRRQADYAEVAALFDECAGRMRTSAGRADAMWGAAIARFHAGEFDRCLAALDSVEVEWGGKPSAAFSAIREYVQAAGSGEASEDAMPPVLKAFAPYPEEKKRTRGPRPPSP